MSRSKKKLDDKIEELNLVPIMNLVVCLIPMVLAGMAMVKVGVVNVNAPKFGMGAQTEATDDENKPLNLTIAIANDGFRLSASGADVNQILGLVPEGAEEAEAPTGPQIPKNGENYDFTELYNKLVVIKDRFPDESIVNLTADPTIPVKYIITAMDVMRVRLTEPSYSDVEAFQGAQIKYQESVPELLWPDVVFAVAQ